jgi:SAM-dependent methyltransferase
MIDRGSSVLDLGCGAGIPTTAELAERFVVTGIDASARQIEAARRNVPNANFIHRDFATAVFPSESFDAVIALYSISHVPRDEHAELFVNIASWLRIGGLFLATLGARDSPDWSGEWLGGQMFFSSFDADRNRRLVMDAGFDLLRAEVIDTLEPEGPTPFLWILARRSRK